MVHIPYWDHSRARHRALILFVVRLVLEDLEHIHKGFQVLKILPSTLNSGEGHMSYSQCYGW